MNMSPCQRLFRKQNKRRTFSPFYVNSFAVNVVLFAIYETVLFSSIFARKCIGTRGNFRIFYYSIGPFKDMFTLSFDHENVVHDTSIINLLHITTLAAIVSKYRNIVVMFIYKHNCSTWFFCYENGIGLCYILSVAVMTRCGIKRYCIQQCSFISCYHMRMPKR